MSLNWIFKNSLDPNPIHSQCPLPRGVKKIVTYFEFVDEIL